MDKILKKKRIDSIDMLRAIGIIFMIMGHIGFGGKFDRYIHTFHMPLFFIISGFLYSPKPEIRITRQIANKAKRLLIPYVFYAAVNYVFWIVLEYDGTCLIYQPLVNLVTYNTQKLPIAGALWFLTALFFCELYYILLDRLIKNEKVRVGFVAIISVGMSVFLNYSEFRMPLTLDIAVVGVGFFELGRQVRKKQNKIEDKIMPLNIWIKTLLVAILLVINFGLAFVNSYVNIKSGWFGIIPLFWINAIIGTAAYWLLMIILDGNLKGESPIRKFLVLVGSCSLMFMALNQLVILLIDKVAKCVNIGTDGYLIACVKLVFTMAILSLLAALSAKIKSKPVRGVLGI